MSDNNRLLVPMYMEALLLRKDNPDCLDLSPNLDQYDQSLLGDVLKPGSNKKTTLEKGIHLHWTLPKALKHAFIDEGEEMKFPFSPNRWMIVRVQTSAGLEDMPSRIWTIESDYLNGSGVKRNFVTLIADQLNFKSIGKSFEYPTRSGNNAGAVLTASAPANPFFASFYPGCRNVFGFHDDLKDVVGDATFTYLVTGWYSNPADDPLTPPDKQADLTKDEQTKKARSFEWFRQQWKYAGDQYPESCLLHSSIHTIKWDAMNPDNGIPNGDVEIIVGNTSVEALSVKLRKELHSDNIEAEHLLNALQYQLLEDDHNPPGLNTIKTEIHKRGFHSKNGGIIWEITRVEAADKELESKEKRNHFPTEPGILTDLRQLNDTQVQLNTLHQKTLSLRQEYYLLWFKRAQFIVNKKKGETIPGFEYQQARTATLSQITANAKTINELEQTCAALQIKLKAYPELSGTNALFQLTDKQDDRFWEPNEPVLLLSGAGVGNVDKPDTQGDGKEIVCRTIDQVISRLELTVQNLDSAIPIVIDKADFNVAKIDNLPVPEVKSLVHESLLFDTSLAKDIALLAHIKAHVGTVADKASQRIATFAEQVVAPLQKAILCKTIAADKLNASIQPPAAFAVTEWKQAWSPLFMSWGVSFNSCYPVIKNLDLGKDANWQLDDQLFFRNKFSTAGNVTSTRFYNVSPLSDNVYTNLRRVLPEEITGRYGKLNLISQTLSGVHKALLMQKPTIQLPPLIYDDQPKRVNFKTDYQIDRNELNIVGSDGYRVGSLPGSMDGSASTPFCPFRAGLLKIISLSIIDAFGQEKKIIVEQAKNNPPVFNTGMISGEPLIDDVIPLVPRFLQPSRLQFHWLNHKDEIVYQDAGKMDNPVFGWVVPNFLDNSLMIFDGFGKEVVILQIRNDISKEKGIYLEKSAFPGSDVIPDISSNPPLKKFIEGLSSGAIATGLIDLALRVNLNISGTSPMTNNTSALLCGQPLALVSCAIQLELLGLPAYDQRWDLSGKQNTGGIESVKIPVFLGDYKKSKDGLIGYFIDDDPNLHITTNAPEFSFSKTESYFKKNTPVNIAMNQGPVKMTLLLDPSAGVHLSSGVLPAKFVELFPQHAQELLSSLDIGFLVAPFIAEKVEPGIPVPTSINANWKWTHKSDVTTWLKDEEVAEGKNKQLGSFKKQQVYEGWLKSSQLKPNS